jgi:hypothetical protein
MTVLAKMVHTKPLFQREFSQKTRFQKGFSQNPRFQKGFSQNSRFQKGFSQIRVFMLKKTFSWGIYRSSIDFEINYKNGTSTMHT